MTNFLLLIVCFGIGIGLSRLKNLPALSFQTFHIFIIYVSLPATVLLFVPKIQWAWQNLYPFILGGFLWGLAVLFFLSLQKIFRWDKKTTGCLILVGGFGNISFVGFPVVTAFYGQEGLNTAILIDQGTFLALSILGVTTAIFFSDGKAKGHIIIQKILYFPPFLAFLMALLITAIGIEVRVEVAEILKRLSDTLTPLALVSVGLQMNWSSALPKKNEWMTGLAFKLLLAPLVVSLLFAILLPPKSLLWKVSVIEAAMPPMITASVIAIEYRLRPDLANFMVSIGIPISFITLIAWYFTLNFGG